MRKGKLKMAGILVFVLVALATLNHFCTTEIPTTSTRPTAPAAPDRQIRIDIGMDKSEVLAALGSPNYTSETVDATGKIERYQWGSQRVGVMVVILFQNGKVAAIHKE